MENAQLDKASEEKEQSKENSSGSECLKVCIRVRPRLKNEFLKETAAFVDPNGKSIKIVNGERIFEGEYDQVFSSTATQKDMYSAVEDYVQTVITGINSTIFAYGQTGSGKTHTMFGPNWEESLRTSIASSYQRMSIPDSSFYVEQAEKHGIIPRTIYKLFADILDNNNQNSSDFTIYCSFMQIYNEKLYDLLEDKESKHPLVIRENKFNGIYVQGLTEYVVTNMDDSLTLLFRGERNRITRQTRLNMFSSRSHTIFQILFEHTKADAQGKLRRAKLNLCDLAGSEKIGAEANLTGKHFEELKNINLSLTTLSKVISALSGKSFHIPYRDSKLTRILQDSIGGNTRTCLIVTVAPLSDCADETISTLSFANRAKKVQIVAKANVINASDDALVKKLQQELQYLKDLLQLKRKGGVSDLHRQLLLLQQENDKLRAVHTEAEQVEQLKMENKMMRLELQKVKENGSTINDAEVLSNAMGSESQDIDRSPWKNTSKSYQRDIMRKSAENIIKPDDQYRKSSAKSFVTTVSGVEASKQIELKRRAERDQATENLRSTMSKMGRCPICTLPVPCKHYKTKEDIKIPENRSASVNPMQNNNTEEEKKALTKTSSSIKTNSPPYNEPLAPMREQPHGPSDNNIDNIVFTGSPVDFLHVAPKNRLANQQPHQNGMKYSHNGDTLKDAAMRSLNRKAEIGLRGTGPHSFIDQKSDLSGPLNHSQYNRIRKKGIGNTYVMSQNNNKSPDAMIKLQLKESNNRLRALQELDRRREEQMSKEIAELEMKRKQQEEETQRRINIKKVRLAETGPINVKQYSALDSSLKGRVERDNNKQHRFISLSKKFEEVREKFLSRETNKLARNPYLGSNFTSGKGVRPVSIPKTHFGYNV